VADPFLTRITDRVERRLASRESPAAPTPISVPEPGDPGRDVSVAWGLKLYGSRLARELYAARMQPLVAAPATGPHTVPLASKLCEQADFETKWFVHWCRELRMEPIYHRKIWEDCFALQAIWEAGLLRPGVSALCFGAGEEPLPSYLASRGVDVLATDLAPDDAAAAGWVATGQHATREKLFRPELIDREAFDQRVDFRVVDMNAIPADLGGKFDLCWSLCSLEHVGSTDLACRFVERSVECLKPGGVAIHTTEYNLTSETETVTSGWCVLFTRPQIEALCERLRAVGHDVKRVSFDTGSAPLDQFIDLPPFPHPTLEWISPNALALPKAPHLRLALLGHVSTSIGLIIRSGGWRGQ
jgi:2-polyprenyl-3-methyl-5-hydroxy-6-metoxy-1,4-benzoquinol methylase